MTGSADQLASLIGRDSKSNLDLMQGTVITTGTPIRVDSLGRQLACTSLVAVTAGDTVWVAQVGGKNVILGVENRIGYFGNDAVVNTNASGSWSVALPAGATLVAAVANGAQIAFPHVHVRDTTLGPTGGTVAAWRCYNVVGGAAVASSTIAVSYLIKYTI